MPRRRVPQAEDALATDEDLVERFESLSPEERDRFRIEIFGMDADTTFVARMRLSEHSVHTWDVDVVLNPKATVADSAVELLIDTIGAFASRTGKPDGKERHIHITTSDPKRNLVLDTGETVTLTSSDHEGGSRRWCSQPSRLSASSTVGSTPSTHHRSRPMASISASCAASSRGSDRPTSA